MLSDPAGPQVVDRTRQRGRNVEARRRRSEEAERIATLYAPDLVDRPVGPTLDSVTRLACKLLDRRGALVTLLDAKLQCCSAREGFEAPRSSVRSPSRPT